MAFERLYRKEGDAVRCELCPKACTLAPGERGDCRIRANLDGRLVALTYGLPSAVHLDPVEKKPLYHFHPGRPILSVATAGCNLHCRYCQNWGLSQKNPEEMDNSALDPATAVLLCRRDTIPMVAFTYAEPLAFYEYTLETFAACRAADIDTVLVTAGYANPGPLARLYKVTSAANIDLKGFSDAFYREVCDGTLKPVLDSLVLAKEAGVWLEVTNLVVPTLNDDPAMVRDMARWMVRNLGADTPLHFSRFAPLYKLEHLPPTPPETLDRLAEIAAEEGIRHIYVGNVHGTSRQDTKCPRCGENLVARRGFFVAMNRLAPTGGLCPKCGERVAGVWT
jgi:pyruvate formate lyase activating enzyme